MTEPLTRGDLLDVNVWLALTVEDHIHHAAALKYWNDAEDRPRYFCRVSALSLVRLLMHPGLMAGAPLTLPAAWAVYRGWRELQSVALVDDSPAVEPLLATHVGAGLPARHFTDAYFAALATATGLRLISFDNDFKRFTALDWRRLPTS